MCMSSCVFQCMDPQTHAYGLILHSGDRHLEIVQRPRLSRLLLTFSHTHTHSSLYGPICPFSGGVCAVFSFDPQLKGTYRPNFQMRKSQPSRWRESQNEFLHGSGNWVSAAGAINISLRPREREMARQTDRRKERHIDRASDRERETDKDSEEENDR